jgi:diguanylate cyclase (GGDEF)-like protein
MGHLPAPPRSGGRLFGLYAAITLLPVLVLGFVLAGSFSSQARQRGLNEGRSEAALVARTAIEPLLSGRPLTLGLSRAERQGLKRLTDHAIGEGDLLRLRVRDLTGRVRFSDDGSGLDGKPDDNAIVAAGGATIAELTRLNADANDSGRQGVAAVEIYLPLRAGTPRRRVGVLEVYLPYAPISRDVTAGLHRLYVDLIGGLAILYLALFAMTASVSRGLRRESALNAFLAEHDTLTQLPNRTLFHRRAKRLLTAGITHVQPMVIAIIDLDGFKDVNDTLGHHVGDQLLIEIARRLEASARLGDTVARFGGDEFGLILCDAFNAEQALLRLRDVIEREVEISGLPLSVQASIGFVLAPADGGDIDTLLQRADVALYVAKAQHAQVLRYDATLDHYDPAKLSLVAELRHAIDDGQLVLHYQPQMTVADGRVKAVEALVRWRHPTHGLLFPDKFLPLAERTDLIDRLTDWVLRTALTEIRDLPSPWAADLSVAVNVSARSIGRSGFARDVIATLKAVGVPPERLIVEVTETALLTDPVGAVKVLGELAAVGVKVSLDDFGAGQTSLGYLSALSLHELKIDKSFVLDMLEHPAHAAIVRSIVDLGHNLGLRVVGEGVETTEVLSWLSEAGCDVVQGFLLARPKPVAELARWIEPSLDPRAARRPAPAAPLLTRSTVRA